MTQPTPAEIQYAYQRAIDRLSRSRDTDVRRHAVRIVETEDSMEHLRWCMRAPMAEISEWTANVLSGLDEAARAEGGAA